MKLFAFVAVLGFASAAQLPNSYIPPPSNAGSAGGAGFLQTPNRPINQYLPPGQQSGFRQSSFSGNSFGGGQGGGGGFPAQAGHSSGGGGGGVGGFGGQQGGGHQGGGGHGGQGGFGGQQGGHSGGGQQYRPSGPSGPQIPIIRYNNVPNSGDGSYQFDYETGNGIMQREEGHLNNAGSEYPEQVVQGEYSYTGDDGQLYKVQYKADGNGFQAVGDHLPTPPPIPDAILKSLAINAAAQSGGYGQSGQYQGAGQQGGYSAGGQQGGHSGGGQGGGRPQGGAGGAGGAGGFGGQKPFQPARPSFNAQTGYTY